MTFREDAVAAYRAGLNSGIRDVNPYRGQSIAFAQMWMRGHKTMLTIRSASTPSRQKYLRAQAEAAKAAPRPVVAGAVIG